MSGAEQLIDSLKRAGTWGSPKEAANAPVAQPPVSAKKAASTKKAVQAANGRKAKLVRAAGR
jgi:hypothetical protein